MDKKDVKLELMDYKNAETSITEALRSAMMSLKLNKALLKTIRANIRAMEAMKTAPATTATA